MNPISLEMTSFYQSSKMVYLNDPCTHIVEGPFLLMSAPELTSTSILSAHLFLAAICKAGMLFLFKQLGSEP